MSLTIWKWVVFNIFVLILLALDLGVFHRKSRVVQVKEALLLSALWIALSLAFNVGIYFWLGSQKAIEFFTGYLIEKSLSIDNIFVFLLLFSYFRIPGEYQHKVLFWGIIGALVMRAIFIAMGITLIHKFDWVIYFFGAILVLSGIKLAFEKEKEIHPEKNPILKLCRKFLRVADDYHGEKFFIIRNGKRLATPLFVVLIIVETTDLIFAVDSIPAILAISRDPFIVYTSNVFAILGLRALYFALAGVMDLFHYLHYGLSAILIFVGLKMILAGHFKIPTIVALTVIGGILLISVIFSLLYPKSKTEAEV